VTRLLLLVMIFPAQDGASQDKPITFIDETKDAGLVDALAGMMGHGGAWGDFDGDGKVDLFVGGFCDRPNSEYAPAKAPVPSRLFRNKGDGTFELTGQVEMHARTSGALFVDLDGDGLLELYVSNNAKAKGGKTDEPQKSATTRHSSLHRLHQGKFIEVPGCAAAPPTIFTSRNVGVLDYDGDGQLDLLVVEDKFTKAPRSALLRNKGKLAFEDVTGAAGIPQDLFGLGLAVGDVNGDGRPDFFIAHSNRLFINEGGKFVEYKSDVFDHHPTDGEDWPCGAVFADLNRDGRPDLVVTAHHEGARNRIFLGDGKGGFRDITKEAGLGDVVPTKCPHVEVQDFDNDGWPDIYTSAAWMDGDRVVPLIYRHTGVKDGIPRFEPIRPIKAPMVYYPAGPTADYDGDGRLDIFLINWFAGRRCTLLRNESPKRHWIDVRIANKTMGIGAKIRIGEQVQELNIGYGYASGQTATCHFGLGDAAEVEVEIVVDGKTIKQKTKADQVLTVRP